MLLRHRCVIVRNCGLRGRLSGFKILGGVRTLRDHDDAAINLGGKPEFLAADGQGKVYVNLVDKNEVAVVDTKTMTVVAKWPTAPGGSPVPASQEQESRMTRCRQTIQELAAERLRTPRLVASGAIRWCRQA